jgi:hypothetical protein
MTAPRWDMHCIPTEALRDLAAAMDRLEFWYRGMQPNHDKAPCLRELEMSPSGRLTAHVSFAEEDSFVVLEYIDGRWEEMK